MATHNPAQKVPEPLRRHLHLKSMHKYPVHPQLTFPPVVEYLANARQVVRDVAAMQWTYLTPPPDGTVMLFWQMPDDVGFGSDGYIWGDVENTFSEMQQGSYVLEVRSHRTGFRPGETVATHARHRYRLRPINQEGLDQYDPSLWLVHWCRAQPNDHAQSDRLTVSAATKALLEERKAIEKAGVPVRKDFMLSDAANYPTITMPPPFSQYLASRGGIDGQPAAKRQRRDARTRLHEVMEDETEDRDLFDMLTPRDVSIMRYTKHSDWMEELMASPFSTSQILPVSLGLGRSGALAAMTKDFFDAPIDHTILPEGEEYLDEDDDDDLDAAGSQEDDIAQPISADKAAAFAKRAEEQVASINAEIEALKREHEERLAQLGRTAAIREAESRLRAAESTDAIDTVVRDAEKLLGRTIEPHRKFQLVQRGGLVERTPSPSPEPEDLEQEGDAVGEDTDMADGPEFGDDSAFADLTNADADFGSPTADVSIAPPSQGQPQPPTGEQEWEVIDRAEAASAPTSAGLPPSSAAPPVSGAPVTEPSAAGVAAPAMAAASGAEDDTAMDLGDGLIDFGDDNGEDEADGADFGPAGGEFEDSIDFGDLAGDDDGDDDIVGGDVIQDSASGSAPQPQDLPAPAPAPTAAQATSSGPTEGTAPVAPAPAPADAPADAEQAAEEGGELSFADDAFGDAFGRS